jgi:hypothetical protein
VTKPTSPGLAFWLGLLILALVLRLGVLALHQPWDGPTFQSRNLHGDAVEYHRIAVNLSEGRPFSKQTSPPYAPDALRTPVYPGFVALIYKLAGPGFLIPALVQIAMALLTILMLTRWCSRELGTGAAVVAGLLFALDIDYAHLNVTLWSETLYLLFLVPAMIIWSGLLSTPRPSAGAAGGVLFGLAALTRPAAALIAPLAALSTFLGGWLGGRREKRRPGSLGASRRESGFWAAILLAAMALSIAAPWVWRNHETFGIARLSSSAGWNLLHVHAARLLAATEGKPVEEVQRTLDAEVDSLLWAEEIGNPLARSDLEAVVALEVFRKYPGEYAKLQLGGMANLLLSPGRSRWVISMGGEPEFRPVAQRIAELGWVRGLMEAARGELWISLLAVVRVVWLLALYALAALGLYALIKERRIAIWFPFAAYALYALLLAGPLGDSRFRVALLPSLVIFAGAGWTFFRSWRGGIRMLRVPGR